MNERQNDRLLLGLSKIRATVLEGKKWIFLCENEKCARRANEALGIVATAVAEDAENFTDEMAQQLNGASVAIIPDNDEKGLQDALLRASKIYGLADEVRIVKLPNLAPEGDIVDWIEAGGTREVLQALLVVTPNWKPSKKSGLTAAEKTSELGRRPVSVRLADVEAQDVQWLWQGRIPLRKVAIIDGDPDLGKSTLALDLAARVTTGSRMPDDTISDLNGPADVILISIEDGAADTIRPRADAAGADVHRVHLLNDIEVTDDKGLPKIVPWVMPRDLDMLRKTIEDNGAKLVILDPLVGVVDGSINLHNDQETRAALRPLAAMADEMGFSVVALRHINKSGGQNAKHRGGGSIAIIGAARSGLLVGLDPDDESGETKVIATTKHNLSKAVPSMRYRLVSDRENPAVARVEWLGESPLTASALLAEPQSEDQRCERDEIADIITELTTGGPYPYQEAVKQIKAAGYHPSESTIRRAIHQAGCVTEKAQGFGGKRSIRHLSGSGTLSSQALQSSLDGTGDATELTRENDPSADSPFKLCDVNGLYGSRPDVVGAEGGI
jgi:hypothetical protein